MYKTSFDPGAGFRVAGHSDIITAARMVFESYAPYIPIMGKIPPTIFEDFGHHIDQGNMWLLEYSRSPIGMLVLTPGYDHLLLQSMAVLPQHQRQGHGRSLLRFADHHAKGIGLPKILLYTNSLMERNQRMYKQHGYRETHRTAYDWGWRVHMERKVPRSAGRQPSLQHLSHALG